MRTCVQVMLRPLLLAEVPTLDLGLAPLRGVPRYEPQRGESLYAAVGAMLAHHGRAASYDWLLAAGGGAFQLYWRRDLLWCPSARYVAPDEPLAALGASVGVQWRRRAGHGFVKALRVIRNQLALGRPVLTPGLLGKAEWNVVVAISSLQYRPGRWHDDPPVPFVRVTARTPEDPDDEYTWVDTAPWSGYCPGPHTRHLWSTAPVAWVHAVGPQPAPEQALAAVLDRAIRAGSDHELGVYAGGGVAYDAWAQALTLDAEFEDLPLLELDRRVRENAVAAARLRDARRGAVRFLRQSSLLLPALATRRLLALAAREYETAADLVTQVAQAFDAETSEGRREAFLDADRRATAAGLLAQAKLRERTAAAYLVRAWRRLG